MENFSAIPRIGTLGSTPGLHGSSPSPIGGFDMGGFPGFDLVQRLLLTFGLDPSLLVTLGMSLTLLTSLLSFFTYSFGSLTTITHFMSANLVSSATIHSSDVTYLYIMRWLAVHKISTDCRLFCVTSRKNPQSYAVRRYSSYVPYGDGNRSCQEDDEDGEDDGGCEDDSLGPKLKYTPAPGFFYFWHGGRPIIINRKLDLSYYTGDIPDETIILTTIGRSPSFLRNILNEARRDYLQAQSRKTMVYTLSPTPFAQKTWDQGRHRPSRDISTVIMPPEQKEFLLQDVKEYLNPHTMRWYAQRGLPYRRGYLFYGPPGTGKTSLSLALAGELKLPLYILSLSTGSLTDETLTMLFVGLPRKCIVLLEDIDCAGVHRSGGHTDGYESDSSDDDEDEDSGSDGDSEEKPSGKSNSKGSGGSSGGGSGDRKSSSKGSSKNSGPGQAHRPRISVSFSGLLNAIDGVASHEGRILIMTTNHRERLDSALIRPGRVDTQIEFGYAAKETLAEIFRELYKEIGGRSSISLASGGKLFDKKEKQMPESAEKERVRQLADTFSERIPANRFTPAEIQGYLMSYKGQPEKAMDSIDDWVLEKTKVEREKKSKAERKKRKEQKNTITEPEKEAATQPIANGSTGDGAKPREATSHAQDVLTHSLATIASGENLQPILHALLQLVVQNSPLPRAVVASATAPRTNGVAINGGSVGGNRVDCYTDNHACDSTPSSKDEEWERITKGGAKPNGANGVNCIDKKKDAEMTNGINKTNGVSKTNEANGVNGASNRDPFYRRAG